MKAFIIIKWTLGVFSLLAGVLCLLYFYVVYWNVSETQKWPTVSAVVDETTVAREERSKGVTYCPTSTLNFQLNGTSQSAELKPSGYVCSRSEDSARQATSAWPKGKEVQIHVNPVKPSQVRLLGFSLSFVDYLVLLVGCMCFLLLLPLRHLKAQHTRAQ